MRILLTIVSALLVHYPASSIAQSLDETSLFVRFQPGDATWEGELQTAITTYENDLGVSVELVSAIHIAEKSYFQQLNEHFRTRHVVLYELVAEADQRPQPGTKQPDVSSVSFMQRALANFLQLDFQLEQIDYSPGNFQHADLNPEQLRQIMLAKNENFFSMFLNLALAQIATEQAALANGTQSSSFNIISVMNALAAEDKRTAFKFLFAEELGRSGGVIIGAELENQLTLLGDRNSVALQVLQETLADNSNRAISLFYGAAHMPGMERELLQSMGFTKTTQRWLTAWQIP
ncbi:MAG TPA: hypothetical protein DCM64_06280 [Gammaproteobacteria bacterium]|jgi:hypothetical protein|nr:hypothetical protein [Gammaproteobacteria bacterium]MDP6731217.1 hypothetical protein [Gammaproteobacteria bacterium]HAJ76046.1 hypothetical protein [Gammaproteobacteria bacterium]|tara:strand:+ start:527 stop:1399 length:873 start_codon:yes stop_codon:yes gene_type:complete